MKETIGHYQLNDQLGSGGMGIVWEAWDERLHRRVALKQLLPGDHTETRRRQRLRREARAVAGLSHPAIVQVFDLLTDEDHDWIVMELVSGQSIARRLQDGPLELSQVVSLAHEIAEGLAEAHAKGFLHRDLKTENVLLTTNGHAKILDFGLAKSYRGNPDAKLTSDGERLGTWRAMSPEQVQDAALDPRSDLFSLGVLLYEMVTGVSPFRGSSVVETIQRVCRHQQAPAAECNPTVPEELSELIDELLHKEREHRPIDAHAVARRLATLRSLVQDGTSTPPPVAEALTQATIIDSPTIDQNTITDRATTDRAATPRTTHRLQATTLILMLLAVVAAVLLRSSAARRPLFTVAVAEPLLTLGQDREQAILAAAAVRSALLRGLTSLTDISPLSAGPDTPGDGSHQALARALAADEVITSRLDCGREMCQVIVERHRGASEQVLWVESLDVPIADLPVLATAVDAALGRGYPDHRRRPGMPKLTVRPADYARYLEIDRAFWTRPEGMDLDRLLAELAALRETSPRFPELYMLEARLRGFRHHDTRDPADLEPAFALLREARTLAPADPRIAATLLAIASPVGRLDQAQEAVDELEELAPGDPQVLVGQALLAEQRAEGGDALELMRTAARRRPSWRNLFELANLEYRQGKIAEARQTLQGLRRSFPDDVRSLAFLAQLELLAGDPARAAELYGRLVENSPRMADLSNLGTAQMLLADYGAAARSFQQAMELAPKNPAVVLNAADTELLLGNKDQAHRLYQRVVELVADDPSTFWQWQTVRGQALAHLGEVQGAVVAAREARHRAPDNPQVTYEAALIYALVGDEEAALLSAGEALEGGVEPRWFSFPWFDNLRHQPTFAAALRDRPFR